MAIEYFCCYHSYLEIIEPLTDVEKGRLFTACLEYSMTGEVPQLNGNERYVFPTFKSQIDRDNQKYSDRCRKNAENGKSGGRPKKQTVSEKTERFFEKPKKAKEKEKAKAKEKEKEKDIDIPPVSPLTGGTEKKFSPPTVEQVRDYCLSINGHIDPQAFVDWYTSNGWKVGKNPMKDWKAAVRTWERKEANHGRNGSADSAVESQKFRDIGTDL